MSILDGTLNQTVTHWAVAGRDEYGDPSFAAPTTFPARVVARNEIFYDGNGNQRRSETVMMTTAAVDFGDFVYVGTSTDTDPTSVTGSRQVQAVQSATDLGGDDRVYRIML